MGLYPGLALKRRSESREDINGSTSLSRKLEPGSSETSINSDFYVYRKRDLNEPFPGISSTWHPERTTEGRICDSDERSRSNYLRVR